MRVKINIPQLYRHIADGLSAVEVEGTTVEAIQTTRTLEPVRFSQAEGREDF